MESITVRDPSQFNLNCTNFTVDQLKVLNLTRGVTAMVCAGVTLSIIIFLVYHKAFSSMFQRLYIYLLIVTFLIELSISLSVEHQFQYSGQEEVCVLLGFITNWLSVTQMIYILETIIYLICLVIFAIHKNCFQRLRQSKLCQKFTEALLSLLPILLSFGYSWEPYIGGNRYGLAGPFCWIRLVDENCEHVGTRDQMIYYSMFEVLGITGITVQMLFAVIYCRLASSMEARYLLQRTLIVMFFQFIYTLTITIQLCVRLYSGVSKQQSGYGLWQAFSFVSPLRQLLFPVGCLVCLYPVKDMFVECFTRRVQICCCEQSTRRIENVRSPITQQATCPESTRVSQPSHTFFIVPHPDKFDSETSYLVTHAETVTE